jgi:CRP-like cAMP-binding protein
MARRALPEEERLSIPWLMERKFERPTEKECAELLGQLPIFSGLRQRQLRQIAKLVQFVQFDPGDFVIQAGEPGDSLYLILAGTARVIGKGRARPLRAGDFFGEMALLDGEPRSATITATSELRAIKLRRGQFTKVLAKEPRMAVAIMEELAHRVRRLEKAVSA